MRRPVLSWYDTTTDEVRVGHAERDEAATRLGASLTAGRLEWDEYDERLTAAYAARTRGDLARLFTDLPDSAPEPPAGRGARRSAAGGAAAAVAIAVLTFAVRVVVTVVFVVLTVVTRVVATVVLTTLASQPAGRGSRRGRRRGAGFDGGAVWRATAAPPWQAGRDAWCAGRKAWSR